MNSLIPVNPSPADVIEITGCKFAMKHGGFSYYELRKFRAGKDVTPFIEQCFVDLMNLYRGIKPPPAPVPVIKPERVVNLVTREQKSGMTTEEREDLIINLVFNHGQLSADELAGALDLYRDQALIDINRLVRGGVLAVVPDGAMANKSYEIVRGGLCQTQ
jgi:hypothetical protein